MTQLILDVETTIKNKGNPFTRTNSLVVVGIQDVATKTTKHYWYPDANQIKEIQFRLDNCSLLIGFNIKFDLHWLRRIGIKWDYRLKVWDCQLAEFLLEAQSNPFPSLNNTLLKYNKKLKLDVIKEEYWDKDIDTTEIPQDILGEYLDGDLNGTGEVYHEQLQPIHTSGLTRLFSLQCQDLLVLEEMEWNGMLYDTEGSKFLSQLEQYKIDYYESELKKGYENVPINWDSKDHLSCYLYGGTIVDSVRIPIGVYKTGAKIGETRYKIVDFKYELEQQVKPIEGSELKKDGYYATNEPILRSIKGTAKTRRIIDTILERSQSAKLQGTYYDGLPKLIEEMDWTPETIHGQFNQCIAITGRLSSNKPNLQNFAKEVKALLKSRYI